jgi:hypothetical protein
MVQYLNFTWQSLIHGLTHKEFLTTDQIVVVCIVYVNVAGICVKLKSALSDIPEDYRSFLTLRDDRFKIV